MLTQRRIPRFISLLVITAILFAMLPLSIARADGSPFAGGTGEEDDPYQIATADQLDKVRYFLSDHFILIGDIDLNTPPFNAGEGWTPIGTGYDGAAPHLFDGFKGTFDGKGHTISNLMVNRPGSKYQGLFASTQGDSVIKNVGLIDANVQGDVYVGSLAGYNDRGSIINCYAVGKVTGSFAGGLVGYNSPGTITRAYTAVNVVGAFSVGGVVGVNNGTMENSYATGEVSGGEMTGGLVGHNYRSIKNSYAIGNLQDSGATVGGLAGYNQDGTITNSYYDTDTTGQSDTDKGEGKSTDEMKDQNTYIEWGFGSIWAIDPAVNDGYPYLRQEVVPEPAPWFNPGPVAHPGTEPGTTSLAGVEAGTGNRLVVQVSSGIIATPNVGDDAPTVSGVIDPYEPDDNIPGVDVANNKFVGLYEVNAANKVVRFDVVTLTGDDIQTAVEATWKALGTAGFSEGAANYVSLYVYDGMPYVAYQDGENFDKATVKIYVDGLWKTVGNAGFSEGTAADISLYVYEGTPYVVYQDGENSNKATLKKYTDNVWKTVGDVSLSEGVAYKPSLYVYQGTPYVAYQDAGNDYKATVKKYTDTGWELVGSAGFSEGTAAFTSLYVYEGTPYVAYRDGNSVSKATVKRYTDSEWKTVGSAGFSEGAVESITLYVYKGTPYVAYSDGKNSNKATVMKYTGNAWGTVGSAGFSEGTAQNTSLYVYKGTPYVAYIDGGSNFKATVKKYTGSAWESVGGSGFSKEAVSFTSLYVYEGTPYVAYSDGENLFKATVMKYESMPSSVPGAPTVISATAGDGEATVSFTPPASDGGSPIMEYTVISSPEGKTGSGLTSPITVEGLTNGTAYTFTVIATNANGDSLPSAESESITPMAEPTYGIGLSETDNHSFSSVAAGYAAQTPYSVTVSNTGTGATGALTVALSGAGASAFTLSHTSMGIIAAGSSDSFTVVPNTRLVAGSYSATVTVSGDWVTPQSFTVSFTVTETLNNDASLTRIVGQSATSVGGGNGSTPDEAIIWTVSVPYSTLSIGLGDITTVTGATYQLYTDSAYSSEITGNATVLLTAGGTKTVYVKVIAQDGIAAKYYLIRVSRASSSGGGSSAPQSPDPTTDAGKATGSGIDVYVNGKAESAGTATVTKVNNRTVTTITIDPKKLEAKLAAEGQHAVVTIPSNMKSDVVIGELNGQMVKNMEQKHAVLKIMTGNASYTLPAEQINMEAISNQMGRSVALEDIRIQIVIAVPTADMLQLIANAAEKGSFTLAVPPIDFTVRAVYGDSTVEVSEFTVYVERTIAIPDGIDPNRITTGVVIDPDGTVRHVPTKVTKIDDAYYAVINSLTNSAYSIVWHPLEFKDAAGHWAKDAINDMGSRMIVNGTGDDLFSPDRDITRAEFAAILVRGLGLKPNNNAAVKFSDVRASDWYSGAVGTAYAYGLLNGYEDGSFRPNEAITREQAMRMLSKAIELTGLPTGTSVQGTKQLLQAFKDADRISAWAVSGAADSVSAGLVSGRADNLLAPKAYITRAEVATMMQRLLQKSDLINE